MVQMCRQSLPLPNSVLRRLLGTSFLGKLVSLTARCRKHAARYPRSCYFMCSRDILLETSDSLIHGIGALCPDEAVVGGLAYVANLRRRQHQARHEHES